MAPFLGYLSEQEYDNAVKLDDPKQVAGALECAVIMTRGSIQQQADLISYRRDCCKKRGYHIISESSHNGGENDPRICLDCELWFGKRDDFVDYRVLKDS